MTPRTIFVDTTVLPSDVFTYHDDDFYNLMTQLAGPDETALLKIQGIRTVNAFLRTSNIFDILNIDSEEINNVKNQTCFILKDDGYIIKPGIKASMEYVRELFGKKQNEITKNANNKRWNISAVSSTTITTPDSSLQMITSTDSSLQTITSTDTTVQRSTTISTTFDTIDHRSFIIKSMNEWCLKHVNEIGISDLILVEGTDYVLTLSSPTDNSAYIRCGCRASAQLVKQGKKFQLSNYYRHLKTGTCSMLISKQQKNNINVDASKNISIHQKTSSSQRPTTENIPLLSSDSTPPVRSKRSLSISGIGQLKKRRRRS